MGAAHHVGPSGSCILDWPLASQILDDGLYFGDSERDVAAVDEALSAPPPRVGAPAAASAGERGAGR